MDTFIVKFVLCEECKNPETDLKITKDGHIIRDCKACGQRTNVDLRHKLSGYILKNPPGKESGDTKKGSKKSKSKSKKSEDKAEKDTENGSGGNSDEDKNGATPDAENDGDASDDELTRRIQQEAKELPKASQDGTKDDGWAIDMSQDAIDRRAQALADSLSRVAVAAGDEEEEEEEAGDNPYEKLGTWIEEKKKSSGSVDDVEIYKKCVELGIEKKHKTLQVLAQTLFDETIVKQIPNRAQFLRRVCVTILLLIRLKLIHYAAYHF